ncbi:hypothetical protein [Stenotrophomonas maltophilia]|uniref:hypothetical protein n=1 Tax=Stenotrophomonas maltophilia TaxID=40324 RepID=UPI0021C6CD8C|nr:hypothetical protein [Stenotrophomonas maltophilia]MCU1139475.1 hypothetical protein [Stenotrophomonas maltophilia]
MSSKHTPGPWIAYEIAPDDPEWGACEIWPDENDREDEEGTVKPVATMVMGVENARLIAAAPELLAALQVAELALRERGLRACGEYKQIEAAIAKATGGAQ